MRRIRPDLEVLEDRTAPAVLTVNSLSDSATPPSNVLTLREAIQVVDSGSTAGLSSQQLAQINQTQPLGSDDTIVFDTSLTANGPANIDLGIVGDDTFGPSALLVTKSVSIIGPSGPNGLTLARDTTADPNGLRLFYVTSSGNLTLQNLTLSGGLAQGGSSGSGGGAAGLGGAVVNAGSLTLLDDTVSGNQAIGGSSVASGGSGGGGLGGNAPGEFVGGPPNGGAFLSPGGFGGGGGAEALGGFGGGGGGGGGGVGGFGGGGGNGAGEVTNSHPLGGFGGGNGSSNSGVGGGGAGMGGGIFNYGGVLTITNSTLAGNTAQGGSSIGGFGGQDGSGFGGAIYNLGDDGVATQNGPALPSTTAAVSLVNSILAGSINGFGSSVSDFVTNTTASGTQATSGENNLIQNAPGNFAGGTDTLTGNPHLSPPANNGGPTETMALSTNSPAYHVGTPAKDPITGNIITTDQRGDPRPTTDPSLGGFEPQITSTTTTATNATATFGATNVTLSATVTEDGSTTPVPEGQVRFTVVNSSSGQTLGTAATGTVNNSGVARVSYGLPGGPLYTPAGSYTIEADYSDNAGNFADSSDTTHTLTVNAATPTVSVTDAGGTYTGKPYAASATAVGLDGKTPVNGNFTFTYYSGSTASGTPLPGAPTNTGTYTVVASFTSSDPNYTSGGSAQTTFTITTASASIQFTSVALTPNPSARNHSDTETISVHLSSPSGIVNQGTVTFILDGQTVNAAVDAHGDATANLTLPLKATDAPQSIDAVFSDPNFVSDPVTQIAQWSLFSRGLASVDTFSTDGSQSVQSYLAGQPLLDFLYTAQGQLEKVVFGSGLLSWDYSYFGEWTVVTLDGVLPLSVSVRTPQGQFLGAAALTMSAD